MKTKALDSQNPVGKPEHPFLGACVIELLCYNRLKRREPYSNGVLPRGKAVTTEY